jgi:hypothetical protein
MEKASSCVLNQNSDGCAEGTSCLSRHDFVCRLVLLLGQRPTRRRKRHNFSFEIELKWRVESLLKRWNNWTS